MLNVKTLETPIQHPVFQHLRALGIGLLMLLSTQVLMAGNYTTPKARWDFYLQFARQYSPEALAILEGVEDEWELHVGYADEATTEAELVYRFNVVVHEACHGMNSRITGLIWDRSGYFIDPSIQIDMENTEVYNSNELNQWVPKQRQDSIFRYAGYVGEKTGLTSQVLGYYGLMDEFTAYYQGAKATQQSKAWFKQRFGNRNPEPWVKNYLPELGASISAFYEFRLFFAWYLQYAQKKHPEIYTGIVSNTQLKKAFRLVYERFEDLSESFPQEVESVAADLRAGGHKIMLMDGFILIMKPNGSGDGNGHHLDSIAYLKRLWTKDLSNALSVMWK